MEVATVGIPGRITRRVCIAAAVLGLLSACAPVLKTEVLQPLGGTLSQVDILVSLGRFSTGSGLGGSYQGMSTKQEESFVRLVPAVLRKNGLAVAEFKISANFVADVLRATEQPSAVSHVLLVEGEKLVTDTSQAGAFSRIEFNVRLFDRSRKRTIWKAVVRYHMSSAYPNARAEEFARDLLLSLALDSLIPQFKDGPVDLKGQVIKDVLIWEKDR